MKPKRPVSFSNIYFPGLISIILLPLVGVVYLCFYQVKYAMPVNWFDKRGLERFNKQYSHEIDFEKLRNYTKIYLTGDLLHDDDQLKKLPVLMDRLTATNDIKNGICIFLTNKTKYQDIVTTLDISNHYETLGVVPYYNKIFIFRFDADSRGVIALNNKGILFDDIIFTTPGKHFSRQQTEFLQMPFHFGR